MEETTKIDLQIYLGELLEIRRTTYDYFERRKIENKINAIETLLEIPTTRYKGF